MILNGKVNTSPDSGFSAGMDYSTTVDTPGHGFSLTEAYLAYLSLPELSLSFGKRRVGQAQNP